MIAKRQTTGVSFHRLCSLLRHERDVLVNLRMQTEVNRKTFCFDTIDADVSLLAFYFRISRGRLAQK